MRKVITLSERQFIIDNADIYSVSEIAEALGRTHGTIRNYCIVNEIDVKKDRKYLSAKEIDYIYANKDNMTVADIARNLGRSPGTIYSYYRVNNLEGKKITDTDFIIENKHRTVKEIASMLGKDTATVRAHCKKRGIDLRVCKNYITEDEKDFMQRNTDMTAKEFAELFGRSASSIHHFCKRNNIEIKRERDFKLTAEDKAYILRNRNIMNVYELSKGIGKSIAAVRYVLRMGE